MATRGYRPSLSYTKNPLPDTTGVVASQQTSKRPDQVPGVQSPTYSDVGIYAYNGKKGLTDSQGNFFAEGTQGFRELQASQANRLPAYTVPDNRRPVGAPLIDPRSGASGRAGSLGINSGANTGSTNPSGVIEQSRQARQAGYETKVDAQGNVIKTGPATYGATGERTPIATPGQIETNRENLQGIADVGFGVSREDRAAAKRLEDLQKALTNPNLGMSGVDAMGNPIIDRNLRETQKANLIAQFNAETERGKAEQQAKVADLEVNPLSSPSIQSFLNGLPEDKRLEAESAFSEQAKGLEQQKALYDAALLEAENTIKELSQKAIDFANEQASKQSDIDVMQENFNQQLLQSQLESAERAMQIEEANAAIEFQRTNQLFERQIRDQRLINEKNRKDQLLGLGISGGWRASRQTADVIDALAKGDRIISDLRTDQAYAGDLYTKKLNSAVQNWQSNTATAYDTYKASALALKKASMEAAIELDKTVWNNTSDRIKAISDLKTKALETLGDFAAEYGRIITDENKFLIEQAADARKEEALNEERLWDRAMELVDVYGTQNIPPQQLRNMEASLGLVPGALDGPTLAEVKARRSGSGTGAGASGPVADEVTMSRNRIRSNYPSATPEQVDYMVYGQLYNLYHGDSTGREFMQDVYKYQAQNPIDGQSYRLYTFSPASANGTDLYNNMQTEIQEREMLSSGQMTPNELFEYILAGYQGSRDNPSEQDVQDALNQMREYGYTDVPNWWFSRDFQPISNGTE